MGEINLLHSPWEQGTMASNKYVSIWEGNRKTELRAFISSPNSLVDSFGFIQATKTHTTAL